MRTCREREYERRAAMRALRTVHLLLCWLPSTLSADVCDCEQYGALSAERGDAACDNLAATNEKLAAGNDVSPCFDSCCTSLEKKQALDSALVQTADASSHWWPWLVIARLLCQCFALLSTRPSPSARSHTDALQVIVLLLAANLVNLRRSGARPSELWRSLRSPGRKGWFQVRHLY
jgi:hypothetical protein|tara:strand:+ start:710 stop:1240 length:531 start_codon:yes stop_codon:yes gene_type:complete